MAPKKGKGSKLARMSDEERARYLQHRAAIEEEARRRKQQLIETFIKNKLKKEEAFSRLNVAKINQQWRQTLRVLKCKELQKDLDALHQWFDHTAEKKDELIECLIGDLQEAENQYARVHQCHMETIDKLLSLFNGRISVLQQAFEERRDEMFTLACNEIESAEMSAEAEQEHLHAIIYKMQETADKENAMTRAVHTNHAEELNNHMLTELENIVNDRGARMELLWGKFQSVLQTHWEQTEDRRREYLNLRQADEENCSQIFKYHQQISVLNDTLSQLRNQISSSNTDESNTLREKQAEKDDCSQLFHVLRQKLSTENAGDRRKLCLMSAAANAATKDLAEIVGKGQQILQILELCTKLEGECSPPENGANDANEGAESSKKAESESGFDNPLAEQAVRKFAIMERFWKKFNKKSIEKEALYLQCQVLENEQRQLKSALKKLFSEFSTNQSLPVAPLTINRPASTTKDLKSMTLKGEKVSAHIGKTDLTFSQDDVIASSLMHTLTIALTKT